jgi:hypothetical protein
MLDELMTDMRLQDRSTAEGIVRRLGAVARTQRGDSPDGLWLELAPAHQNLFGVDVVDLAEGPDMSSALSEAVELQRAIADDVGRVG